MPLHKILFWSGFGVAVRFWQLGIEMRPFFQKHERFIYIIYAGIGGGFGYWLQGVEQRNEKRLNDKRDMLLAKRARRAALLAAETPDAGAGTTA
ncbi:hypothetical protein K490DRAFT_65250 [Saccharata proteae CBS 121410]|uniref:NADH-ubiquinone oxidoreductase 14 kDa subunit n=1 Tax=Saccharata proteae CBS 121410 TaxID=1314787 RepID=A0A9P4HTX3_9PEZI|nr:hypothetical protein K490DRAFT_65250 [Saccharata proteae CBS 121410]